MGFKLMSQQDVANYLGCARSTVSQKCAGRIRFSTAEIYALADLFHVSADALLGLKPLEVA